MKTNPLLNSFLLPPFNSIYPENIVPAIKSAIKHCKSVIKTITEQSGPYNWNNFCQPLADADDYLRRIWSPIAHLNSVKNSQDLRKPYEQSLLLLTEYSTWVGQNSRLYLSYKKIRESQGYIQMTISQKKSVDNILQDFELSGIKLSQEKQKRYGKITVRLSKLYSAYSNNVLDATMNWNKLITDKKLLSGMSKNALLNANIKAQNHKQKGWLLTLDAYSYFQILTYCDNALLRKEVYWAYNTRASDQGPNANKWDNGPLMNEILTLRHELAQLLEFKSYANKSLVTKMVKNPQQVLSFLTGIVNHVRSKGADELDQLRIFALNNFGHSKLEPWDIAYYSKKQKQHLFSINDEQLRSYFPESQVISGLFEIIYRIYGIKIKERINVETWHSDVKFFDIFNENKTLLGSFYLDLYSRDNKQSGAWMDSCLDKMRRGNGELQKPVAYIVCNFNRPIKDKPALFTHNEVITLFHEFGHGLHHILTCIDTPGVSGINGVPWDAVELPSQFMENYCWQPEVLELISKHYKTGKKLPKKIINSLIKTRSYQIALFILRQLELSLFDFYLHYQYKIEQGPRVLETLIKIKKETSVMPIIEWDRFPHTFSHIFSGGYAAGYYSYLWSAVLALDVWSYFEEKGIFNQELGKSFLKEILSRGGSEDLMTLFIRFRGRKPQLDAMLHYYNILNKNFDKIF